MIGGYIGKCFMLFLLTFVYEKVSQLQQYILFIRFDLFIKTRVFNLSESVINYGNYAWNSGPIMITESFYLLLINYFNFFNLGVH